MFGQFATPLQTSRIGIHNPESPGQGNSQPSSVVSCKFT